MRLPEKDAVTPTNIIIAIAREAVSVAFNKKNASTAKKKQTQINIHYYY